MNKLTRDYESEEELLNEKHQIEISKLKDAIVEDIRSVLKPGKLYDLEKIELSFWLDPGMFNIVQISSDGLYTAGGKHIGWYSIGDIYYFHLIVERINSEKFIL